MTEPIELRFRGLKYVLAMGSMALFALLGLMLAVDAWSDGEGLAGAAALAFAVVVGWATMRMRHTGYVLDGARLAARNGVTGRHSWVDLDEVEVVTPFHPAARAGNSNVTLWSREPSHLGISGLTARAGTGGHRAIVSDVESRVGRLHPFPVLLRDLRDDDVDHVDRALLAAGLGSIADLDAPIIRGRR